ncbi:iron complex outermembrane recepter protein [Dyella sp. OK004]|uniref:TonB-dependent receptor n=1 Tax=Dyella sp. OK004 TaxID=1855292 RepID=UPI0008E3F9DC|nr:TonB-dependent receptor [Dyella sp. OK004]SFS17399.1 iron complex outermembrane recepter protein [Dyella sp. OK004]
MKRNKLALALVGLMLAPASAVFAQSTAPAQTSNPPPPEQAKQLQTITVTGSAIPRIDVETPSPVTVITATQIARSGLTTVSDVVRSISSDNSGSIPNAFANGFAAGSSGVALRGLTVNSTLVLVDGHRLSSYPVADDGQRSFVDLNSIPLAAVERIEVLKDGASSLYGADAIAGVVNIIMRPSFKGVMGTVDIGTSQHGGGFTRKATLLAGGGDLDKDRYNAYMSVQYQKDNPIRTRQRGFPFNTGDLSSLGGPGLGGPAARNGGPNGAVRPDTPGSLWQPLMPCTTGPLITDDTGSYCRFDGVNKFGTLQPAMEQGGVSGRFTVKLNDTTKAYMDASFMETKTWAPGGPNRIQNGTPNNTNNITLPVGNPSNPFAVPARISYNFGDIPSGFNYNNHAARIIGDVSGQVADWNYDVALVLNHSWLNTTQYGFISYTALLDAVAKGTYNFANPGSNSSAIRSALAPGYNKTSTSDMDTLDLSASRTLWDMAGGPMGVAMGAQFRHEAQNDPTLNPNFEFQGLGNAQTKGSRQVSGAYVEFDMPLLQQLEVDASGRFDHYTDAGNNFSPKIGFKYKPFDWVALRGTYSKGFRAPAFSENGSSSTQGFVTYTPPPAFQALHGGSPYVTIPYALSEFTTANKNIKPEKSKSFTFGLVFQPTSWLNASFDYYNIKKSNLIVQADTAAALANYYAGLPQPPGVTVTPDLPDPDHPNAQPRPSELIGSYLNAQQLKTTGMDVDVQAHFEFANNLHYITELSGTQIFQWALTLPDGTKQTYVGTQGPYNLSSGAGTPRSRASWANTVEYGPLTVTGTLYYTSGYREIASDVGINGMFDGDCLTTTPAGTNFPASCKIHAFYDFDLTGSYMINDNFTITASVMNLFDRKAPFDPANYAGAGANYNPTWSQAGVVGRFYNLGVKMKF